MFSRQRCMTSVMIPRAFLGRAAESMCAGQDGAQSSGRRPLDGEGLPDPFLDGLDFALRFAQALPSRPDAFLVTKVTGVQPMLPFLTAGVQVLVSAVELIEQRLTIGC